MDLAFAWDAARGCLRAGGADAFEEDGGGLVVGVLGDESAFEGLLEDGLTEAGGHMDGALNCRVGLCCRALNGVG